MQGPWGKRKALGLLWDGPWLLWLDMQGEYSMKRRAPDYKNDFDLYNSFQKFRTLVRLSGKVKSFIRVWCIKLRK